MASEWDTSHGTGYGHRDFQRRPRAAVEASTVSQSWRSDQLPVHPVNPSGSAPGMQREGGRSVDGGQAEAGEVSTP